MYVPRIIIQCNRLLSEGYLTPGGLRVLGETGLIAVNASLLEVEHRLRFLHAVDVGLTDVAEGETATVVELQDALGAAYIRLDQVHKTLCGYENILALVPFWNKETINALEVIV